ncbi:MAG: hypothetical protein JSV65_00220 [Armatimonadota bacterium]|nr:MAG: hypothetical protein JSV65_00220 [Armatimonadota bacterium]
MPVPRRLLIVLGATALALVVLLAASRELRLTVRDQIRVLNTVLKGDSRYLPDLPDLDLARLPGPPLADARLREDWRWQIIEGARYPERGDELEVIRILERSLERAPRDARIAIRCKIATLCACFMHLHRPEMHLGYRHTRPSREEPPNLLMAERTIRHASAAWKEEPDNALYPQLIAAAYLAQRRDADALAMLERAGRLPSWDPHEQDVRPIRFEALRLSGEARVWARLRSSAAFIYYPDFVTQTVARTAAGIGFSAQRAGDHALAARWYEAVYRMEPVILRDASLAREASAAARISSFVVAPIADTVEMREPRGMHSVGRDIRRLAGFTQMYAYLQRYGTPRAAERVLLITARDEQVARRLQFDWGEWEDHESRKWFGLAWGGQLWMLVALLVCAAAAGLTALTTRVVRRLAGPQTTLDDLDTATSPTASVVRIVLVVVPVAVLCIGLPFLVFYMTQVLPKLHEGLSMKQMATFTAIVLLALLFGVAGLTEAWALRRRPSGDTGFARRWLIAMRLSLLRLVAAFLLLYVIMFIPVSVFGARLEARLAHTAREGDLRPYFKEGIFLRHPF